MEGTRSVLDCGLEVTDAARELAATIDVDGYAERVTDAIMAEVWDYLDDPSFRDAVHISVRDNVRMIFAIVMGDVELEEASAEGALQFAETAAQLGVPSSEVERAYRVGQAFFWMGFYELAVAHADETGVPLAELVGGPTAMLFRYIDHILSPVVTTYDNTRADLHKTRGQLRRLTLMQVIDGTIEESPEELEKVLDYPVGDTHIAILLHSERSSPPEPDVATLRAAVDAEGALTFQHGPRSWIVWLGRRSGFDAKALSRLRRTLATCTHDAAVGEPSAGLEGLRRTRAQALETARVQRLRETLLAWLATGSHVSAAAILGVHENTVRNRIRHAEDLLGSPLLPRRTELQVALRLERVLDAAGAA